MSMKDTGWKVVSVQPYEAVIGGIGEMRGTSSVVLAAFLLLGVGLSFLIAHKLYKPVQKLVNQLDVFPSGAGESRKAANDELSAVADGYRAMKQKLHRAANEQDRQKRIVRNYYLRTLLENGRSLTAEAFAETIGKNGLRIDPRGPFRVVVIKVDGYAEFVRGTTERERSMYGFAVRNISEEFMRRGRFECESADVRGDHAAMLVSPAGKDELGELLRELRHIQETVADYYGLSLSMMVSECCGSHSEIGERYAEAMKGSMNKLLFGRGAILTPDRLASQADRDEEYVFPAEAGKKLVECCRAGNASGTEQAIGDILGKLSEFPYDQIARGLLHTVDLMKSAVRDMNRNRVVPLRVELGTLGQQALEKESLEEIGQLFRDVCRDIREQLLLSDGDKNGALTDAIKEIIELNYGDRNLSLQAIAAMLHLTPAYVGRMFKSNGNPSVAEYLNEVRLKHAQTYLETKRFSIKEIMELVGYVNESTFFKLFKKSFGVTPKEYRLKRALN